MVVQTDVSCSLTEGVGNVLAMVELNDRLISPNKTMRTEKVRDDPVLATDSMTQIQATIDKTGNKAVAKTYDNARELFQVGASPNG